MTLTWRTLPLFLVPCLSLGLACSSDGDSADGSSEESGSESEATTGTGDGDGDTTGDGDGDTTEGGDGDGDGDGEPAAADADLIAAGSDHSCAHLSDGGLRCWGAANVGQLGSQSINAIGDNEDPSTAELVDLGGEPVQLSLGRHSCARFDDGSVRCWGGGNGGALGYGNEDNVGDDESPASAGDVDFGSTAAIDLATGWSHTCVVLDGGGVRCWGQGFFGRLGYGNIDDIGDDELPSAVGELSLSGNAIQVAAGANHSCALLDGGTVQCWGSANSGQLGYGATDNIGDDETPDSAGTVDLGDATISAIACGTNHTCALTDDGAVHCWGNNESGQLGLGNTDNLGDDESPGSAGPVALGGTATAIAAGADHSCALLDDGGVKCWGGNDYGQLGQADTDLIGDDETPEALSAIELGGEAVKLSAGDAHTCAVLADAKTRCWGRGNLGRLGYASEEHIGDDETPASMGDIQL